MSLEKHADANKKLIALLTQLLETGDWDASLFLQVSARQLKKLRSELEQLLESVPEAQTITQQKSLGKPVEPGYREVYISLYQTDGKDLAKWQQTLTSLPELSMSRPVYGEEAHAKASIRAKKESSTEGYVTAHVKETDIIAAYAGKAETDRLGHALLTLKEVAVKLNNIVSFTHEGKCYNFIDGKLV